MGTVPGQVRQISGVRNSFLLRTIILKISLQVYQKASRRVGATPTTCAAAGGCFVTIIVTTSRCKPTEPKAAGIAEDERGRFTITIFTMGTLMALEESGAG